MCMCVYVQELSVCDEECSDGDFETLLNNSLQLHSLFDASEATAQT